MVRSDDRWMGAQERWLDGELPMPLNSEDEEEIRCAALGPLAPRNKSDTNARVPWRSLKSRDPSPCASALINQPVCGPGTGILLARGRGRRA